MDTLNKERQILLGQLMGSQVFLRSFQSADTYQKLLSVNSENPQQVEKIRNRMRSFFEMTEEAEHDAESDPRHKSFLEMRRKIFAMAESNTLTMKEMAELYASSPYVNEILKEYNLKAGDERAEGQVMTNEAIEYTDHGDWVGINIVPTNVKGTVNLMAKIIEGLGKVAGEMKTGKLLKAEKVVMISWLFGGQFQDKVKALFGDGISLTIEEEGKVVDQVRHLALTYNSRALEDYLLNGRLPEVKRLEVDREDFIKRFA